MECKKRIIHILDRKLKASDFLRSVGVLVSGSAISQVTVVLMTPLLTRLYTPEEFGVLSVYLSIVLTMAILSSWHFEEAIPLPKEEKHAVNLLVLSLFILFLNTILIMLILKIFKHPILSLLDTTDLSVILFFLPFSIFGFGLFQLFELWMLRQENYKQITAGKVRMNVSQVFSQIGLGFIMPSAGSLMAGEVIGRLLGGGGMVYVSWGKLRGKFAFVSLKSLAKVAHRYMRFPLVASWSSLFRGFSNHLPTLFIAFALGAKEVGWYFLATRILALPDALLGYSVKQVYIAKSAKLIHLSFEEFVDLYWNTIRKMGLVSCIIYTSLALIAPLLLPIVFGSTWEEAGVFLQCLSVFFFFQFIVGPISATFNLIEEQYIQVLSEVSRMILLVVGMMVAHLFLDQAWHIVLCISLAQALGCLFVGGLSWAALKNKQRKIGLLKEA